MAGKMHMLIFVLLLSGAAKTTLAATCDFSDSIALGYLPIEIVYCGDAFKTWITGTDCCTWTGVTCNDAGKVSALNISSSVAYAGNPPTTSYLVGTGLAALTALESITITNVGFNGALPPSWGNLDDLQTIDIQKCNVVGNIPDEFCNLQTIKTINLRNNKLNGTTPSCLSSMSSLTTLDVSGNPNLSSGTDGVQA